MESDCQERDVERTGRRRKRLVPVHSTLVHCEASRRSVVRMISEAVVNGPSSEIGGVSVGDTGYIVDVAWVCLPFRVEGDQEQRTSTVVCGT
jgi:hypothetical protein